MEAGVAVVEDSPVARHQPVALAVGGRRHADHGLVEHQGTRRAVEEVVGVGEDAAVTRIEPVALDTGEGVEVALEVAGRVVVHAPDGARHRGGTGDSAALPGGGCGRRRHVAGDRSRQRGPGPTRQLLDHPVLCVAGGGVVADGEAGRRGCTCDLEIWAGLVRRVVVRGQRSPNGRPLAVARRCRRARPAPTPSRLGRSPPPRRRPAIRTRPSSTAGRSVRG